MKSIKKTTYLGAITFVIAGLLIVVSASAMVQTSQIQQQKLTVVIKNGHEVEGRDIATAQSLQTANRYSPVPRAAVLVTTGTHPAAASDTLRNVVAGFEAEDNVWFTASVDGGESFNTDAAGWTMTEPPSLPDADSCGDGRFIGSMVPNYNANEGSELIKVTAADPNNIPDGWDSVYWVWTAAGAGYYDFKAVASGGYTNGSAEDSWAYGGHSIIGTYNHATPVIDTPFYSYQSTSAGNAWIYRIDSTKTGCTSTAMDIDQETKHGFAVWNYNNAGNKDILVYESNYAKWVIITGSSLGHPDVKEVEIHSVGNDTCLDVAALNNNVIIVSQRDGDIVAYYSANALTTVNEQLIESDAVNPRVVFTDEGHATCSFIKEGKVYFSTTEDGGATWTTPEAIDEPENVDVPEEFKAADVCGLGALWQQLDGNIYYASIGEAPPVPPILDITSIKGGLKVSANVSNIGGTAATNVIWTMKVTGGMLKLINKTYTANISTLAAAQGQTIQSTGLILGLGAITITISAVCNEGASKQVSKTGKVLLFFIKI